MSHRILPNDQIAAIIPSYTPHGDQAVIISTTGKSTPTGTTIHTVIKRLARSSTTDLIALRAYTAQITQRAILQPLPLAPGLVLVPVKVRQPKISGDTCTGYVNLLAITAVTNNQQPPYRSTLILTGGTELPVVWSTVTIHRHLQHARLVMNQAANRQTLRENPENYPAIAGIATKLIDVIYEILALKRNS
jgi:hypothetical protein